MVFRRLRGALRAGVPAVETLLDGGDVRPGGTLTGLVRVDGGSAGFDTGLLSLVLVARTAVGFVDAEHEGDVSFARFPLGGSRLRLERGERCLVPFAVPLPWETPLTHSRGRGLEALLGVRAELAVAGAAAGAGARTRRVLTRGVREGQPLRVEPLPVQEAVLEALGRLGCGPASARVRLGHLRATGQTLPVYQEVALAPPPQYAHSVRRIRVTFLAGPAGTEIVLAADGPGAPVTGGDGPALRFAVSHEEVRRVAWDAEVDAWLRQAAGHRGARGAATAGGTRAVGPFAADGRGGEAWHEAFAGETLDDEEEAVYEREFATEHGIEPEHGSEGESGYGVEYRVTREAFEAEYGAD